MHEESEIKLLEKYDFWLLSYKKKEHNADNFKYQMWWIAIKHLNYSFTCDCPLKTNTDVFLTRLMTMGWGFE